MPGALTPTEIQSAWTAGASIVKVFPARRVGASYLRNLLAPLPHLRLMPTGGVTLDNIPAFIQNGAVAVGVGSSLVKRSLVAAQNWDELAARTAVFMRTIQQARGEG